MADSEDDDD